MLWLQFLYPILLHLILFHFLSYCSSSVPLCNHDQSSALLLFKNSFSLSRSISEECDGSQSSYPKTASWENGTDCCLWDGVTCDTISGYVIGLDLSCSWLQGRFHQNNTLFQLTHLQTINLAHNDFNGSQMPSHFGGLGTLTYLNLSYSAFNGEIPSKMAQLSKLVSLDLSGNFFSRFEPSPWKKLIQNATDLRELVLDGVNMSFIKPSSLSLLMNLSSSLVSLSLSYTRLQGNLSDNILRLPNLQKFDLSWNQDLKVQLPKSNWTTPLKYLRLNEIKSIEGNLPDSIGYFMSLKYLGLSNLELPGIIPPSFGNLTQLTGLVLDNCKLQGAIPNWMFDLVNLTDLRLSSNNLSGHVEFHQFSKLKNLQYLTLSDNKFLSISFDDSANYTIPNFQKLFLSSCNIDSTFPEFLAQLKNMHYLDLSNNKIRGRVPKWLNDVGKDSWVYLNLSHNFLTSAPHLSSMKHISYIDLSHNFLQGDLPIPPSSTYLFSVSNNKLTGDISSAICNASSLEILNLSHNNLKGHIPQCLGNIPYLSILDLQMNHLSGTIPGNFSKELKTLKFNGNQLEGPLPQFLAQCKQLQVLDLGENNIEDIFPSWLDSLSDLQALVLRVNKFYGIIPRFKTKHPFPKLRIFDVSTNSFSGPLPTAYIKNFKGMMNVDRGTSGLQYMGNNLHFSGSVVVTWKGLPRLVRILTIFATIDLSNNLFEGEIPEVIGELNSLIGLNLSHNRINGTIPQSLTNLTNLEWLDLSSNKLKGEIPMALTNLTFLSWLNLSQNQLVRTIPRGKQFDTFSNDSYEGNLGLCGIPLSKTCSSGDRTEPASSSNLDHEEEESGFGWKAVALGYGCGMVFGMLLGYVVFSTGKPEWLVIIFGGVTNKMMRRRIRNRSRANPNHGRRN